MREKGREEGGREKRRQNERGRDGWSEREGDRGKGRKMRETDTEK